MARSTSTILEKVVFRLKAFNIWVLRAFKTLRVLEAPGMTGFFSSGSFRPKPLEKLSREVGKRKTASN